MTGSIRCGLRGWREKRARQRGGSSLTILVALSLLLQLVVAPYHQALSERPRGGGGHPPHSGFSGAAGPHRRVRPRRAPARLAGPCRDAALVKKSPSAAFRRLRFFPPRRTPRAPPISLRPYGAPHAMPSSLHLARSSLRRHRLA